jgi:hypothetical protein
MCFSIVEKRTYTKFKTRSSASAKSCQEMAIANLLPPNPARKWRLQICFRQILLGNGETHSGFAESSSRANQPKEGA